jgi:hypothetical protein
MKMFIQRVGRRGMKRSEKYVVVHTIQCGLGVKRECIIGSEEAEW